MFSTEHHDYRNISQQIRCRTSKRGCVFRCQFTVHTGRPLHMFCDRESDRSSVTSRSEPQVDKAKGYRLYKTATTLLKNTSEVLMGHKLLGPLRVELLELVLVLRYSVSLLKCMWLHRTFGNCPTEGVMNSRSLHKVHIASVCRLLITRFKKARRIVHTS